MQTDPLSQGWTSNILLNLNIWGSNGIICLTSDLVHVLTVSNVKKKHTIKCFFSYFNIFLTSD